MSLREELQRLVDDDLAGRRECAQSDDCTCSYKDCYECGKWHSCHHTPLTSVARILAEHSDVRHEARPAHPLTQIGRTK